MIDDTMKRQNALIVVDVQKDFCEGGALAVQGGNDVAKKIATYLKEVEHNDDLLIVFTKDWHNAWPDTNDGHFSESPDYVDSWPIHCVNATNGAQFHEAVNYWVLDHPGTPVFYKGQGASHYSGFDGRNPDGISLAKFLKARDVENVAVCGIAADYCVRATALDAVENGFHVQVIESLTVGIAKGGTEVAIEVEDAQSAAVTD